MATLLQQALEAKSRETGERYTYRKLAADSDTHYTTVDKVIRGERRFTEELISAWARALHPYFPEDEARAAAGFKPLEPRRSQLVDEIARVPPVHLDDLRRHMGEFFNKRKTNSHTKEDTDTEGNE